MKHWVLLGVCVFGLAVAAFFAVRLLHHGSITVEEFREKSVVDENVLYVQKEDLYPEDTSAWLFGKGVFPHAFSGRERAYTLREVLSSDGNIAHGWILRDDYGVTQAKRIYWGDTKYWEEDKWVGIEKQFFKNKIPPSVSQDVPKDPSLNREETSDILFGNQGHSTHFLGLKQVASLEDLSPPQELQRGWIAVPQGGEDTFVARIYWDDTSYWLSPWMHLSEDDYITDGIMYTMAEKGWDGRTGNNWPIFIGIIFGLLLVALLVFGWLELLFNESWNKW